MRREGGDDAEEGWRREQRMMIGVTRAVRGANTE